MVGSPMSEDNLKLFSLNPLLFTNPKAKPFIRRGRKARLKRGAA
jgi:hypothetical protein